MKAGWGSRSRIRRGQEPDSIAKNTAASLAAQLTTASLTALLTLFLVRALGVKEYGLFALTIGIGAVTLAFADMGISFSTARFVAEHRGRDSELRALVADALKLKIVVTGLVCALLAALASVIAGIYRDPDLVWPLRVMALATFGQSTYLMLLGVSTARGRSIVNVRFVAAESLLEVSASIALVLAGAGAVGAVFGRAIGYVLGALIAALVVLRVTGEGPVRLLSFPRRETVRRVSGYAGAVFAIDASYTMTASLSVLILGAYAGSAASGIYQAPAKLITLIVYVGASVSNGVGPRLARSPGREPEVGALQGALRGLIGFQCLMLAPAVVWAQPITRVLLGPGYSRSADVLTALAPYIFFSGLAPLVTSSVNYMGEAQRRIPIALATLALSAAAGFVLIPRHGLIGAAIATDIAYGFYTLAHIWLCRGLLKLRMGILVWSLACGLTAAAAMGIVLAGVGTNHLTAFEFIGGGCAGVATYVSMLIFTREIRGAHIARAAATLRALLARQRVATGPRRSPKPAMLPLHAGVGATTRIAGFVSDDATPGVLRRVRPRISAAQAPPAPIVAAQAPPAPIGPAQAPPAPIGAAEALRRRRSRSLGRRRSRVAERMWASAVAAEAADVTPIDRSASICDESPIEVRDGSVMEVLGLRPDRPRVRDRLAAGADMTLSKLRGVIHGRLGRPAAARPPAALRPDLLADDVPAEGRSSAARPPAWVEGWMFESAPIVEPIRARTPPGAKPLDLRGQAFDAEAMPSAGGSGEAHAGKGGRPLAAEPPEWLFETRPERRVEATDPVDVTDPVEVTGPVEATDPVDVTDPVEVTGPVDVTDPVDVDETPRQSKAARSSGDAAPESGSTDLVYQITWRLEDDAGVFELCPAEPVARRGGRVWRSARDRALAGRPMGMAHGARPDT